MKKQILTGEESFKKIIEGNYFYIDKTLFIKELLENRGKVTLITRPRRFGKTMNMSMLEYFFDIGLDSRALFEGLNIMEHTDIVEKYMNRHPVVAITLKDVEESTYEKTIESIRNFVSTLYQEKMYMYENDGLSEIKKKQFYRYCAKESDEVELKSALRFLTECLYTYHKKRVIVLLDEYDIPITNAFVKGYYKDMIDFMRVFLGSVFKTNKYLEFGVLTGVQRISKESLFSCFNNPKVCGIMHNLFTTCFGFTEEEVKNACHKYGLDAQFEKVKRWYNGYMFGNQQDIYNPWSITGFLKEKKFKPYWVYTGSMNILSDIFFKGTSSLKNDIAGLLTNTPVRMKYTEQIRFPISYRNDNIFWSMLLNAGYIKHCVGSKEEDWFYAELVNREVKNIFADFIDLWFKDKENEMPKIIQQFVKCLLKGDKEGVSDTLNKELLNNPSCYDFKEENSYHLFIFGILLAVSSDFTVYSNLESGKGRSDCMIKPADKEQYAVVIEFKHKREDGKDLKEEAEKGLNQIDEKAYVYNLKKEGYNKIYRYGIAFHKKICEVALFVNE